MSGAQWQRIRAEWDRSRRLRLGALAILGILGLQLVLTLSDARARQAGQYGRDAGLLSRLEEASRESAWPARAKAASAELAKAQASIPAASTGGLAQAELQAWLGDLAVFAGIGNPTIKVEPALAVDGQPELWQVLARLDGDMSETRAPLLMHTLSAALPWFRTERLDVQSGAAPRVSLVIRGYFRKGDDRQADAQRPAALPSAAATMAAGAPQAPTRRNPLAPADAVATATSGPTGPSGPARGPNGRRTPPSRDALQRPARRNPLAPPASGGDQAPATGSPATAPPRRRNPLAPPEGAAPRPQGSAAAEWKRQQRPHPRRGQ
jgi:hypothetical protein